MLDCDASISYRGWEFLSFILIFPLNITKYLLLTCNKYQLNKFLNIKITSNIPGPIFVSCWKWGQLIQDDISWANIWGAYVWAHWYTPMPHHEENFSLILYKDLYWHIVGNPAITQESLCFRFNIEEQIGGYWELGLGCDYSGIAWAFWMPFYILIIMYMSNKSIHLVKFIEYCTSSQLF